MKTVNFELKDVGCHFAVKNEDRVQPGTGGIIKVKGIEVPVTMRWAQAKKDGTVGLWWFGVKNKSSALVAHRGEKATLSYPVSLTPEQLGLKKVKKAAPKTPDTPKAMPVALISNKAPEKPKEAKKRAKKKKAKAKSARKVVAK